VSTAGLKIIKAVPKKSVGSTILSEGIVCTMAFLIFIMLGKASILLNPLTLGITAGTCLTSFLGVYIKKIDNDKLKLVVTTFIVLLGVYMLFKAF